MKNRTEKLQKVLDREIWNPEAMRSKISIQVVKYLMTEGNEFGTKISKLATIFDTTPTTMHQICENDTKIELIKLSRGDRAKVKRKIVGWNSEEI